VADGWIALCARDEAELATTCSALGITAIDGLGAAMATGTVEGVVGALRRAGISCEPVGLDQGEAFLDDPLLRSLGLVTSYPHAEWGRLEQVGAFWSLGDLEVRLDRAPPALGQHTVEVLVEAGMAPDAIDILLTAGVVVQAGAGVA
jgi:crotonobetainyl-CoA:carnitine CoA-transferase CaiB-like acyl-CoA transferase